MTLRQSVLAALPYIITEIEEVNQKWHINFDGTPKTRDAEFERRCILLMASELYEAFEAIRKGNQPDDKLPQYPSESVELIDLFIRSLDFIIFHPDREMMLLVLKTLLDNPTGGILDDMTQLEVYETLHETINDAFKDHEAVLSIIDILIDYFELHNIPARDIYRAKTDFNRTRKDHQIESRKSNGGKRF